VTRDFAAELAELRRVYIASLPGKLDEIGDAIGRRSLTDAGALAHRLRGTAGSYGVAAVSDSVGAIEDRVEAAAGVETLSLWSELESLLAAARAVIAAIGELQ
jgi:HPt (histidine-containing phosphotransfer) domain-containing protein